MTTQGENAPLLVKSTEPRKDVSSYRFLLIAPPLAMYHLSMGLCFYVENEWIQHYVQSKIFIDGKVNSSSTCDDENRTEHERALYNKVESQTAKWQMFNNLATFIPGALASTILPAYSDCFGRKFVIVLGCAGSVIKYLQLCFVIYYNISPLYVILGSLVEGCVGGYFTIGSGVFSFTADLTATGRHRTVALATVDGIMLMSVTLSGLGAGYYIKLVGYFIPMVTSFGLMFSACFVFIFLIPESFPKHLRLKTRSVISVFSRTFEFYTTNAFNDKRCAYILLLLAYTFQTLSNSSRASAEMLYQLGRPFCWSAEKIGIFSALRHVAQGIAAIILVRPLQKCFSDLNIAIMSLVFLVGSYVLEALAKTDLMLYMGKP